MSTPELPPLPLQLVRDERHLIHEARERILIDRIAELSATNAELRAYLDGAEGACASAQCEAGALRARIAELEADAERYRWLRDEAQYADDGLPYVIAWKRGRSAGEQEILAEEELDAAIDAARKA